MTKKILLADDSITIQKVVELTFSEGEFDVISVGNGELALRKAKELRPDIALLDVIMPEKNGYEVCQILKQDPEFKKMPVLLLTGTFESFDHQRAQQAGADGYLTKPFESQMLISKVEELLATAPRRVARDETGGRMEIVAEGKIRTIEAQGQPQPAAQPAAPSPPPPAPPPAAPEAWMGEPEPLEVSFPGPPAQPAPEAMAANAFAEDTDSGPPSATGPPATAPLGGPFHAGPTFAREIPEPVDPPPDAPGVPPGSPEAQEQYEQTFELQQGTETVSLVAAPPPPDFKAGTLYDDSQPGSAPTSSTPLSPELVDQIARRVLEKLSDQVLREVAWEVIPDLAELLIKQRISELERGPK